MLSVIVVVLGDESVVVVDLAVVLVSEVVVLIPEVVLVPDVVLSPAKKSNHRISRMKARILLRCTLLTMAFYPKLVRSRVF